MLLLYGMLYPLVRFFTEMQRPDAWKIADIPTAQIIAVIAFVICAVWFAYRHTGPAKPTYQRTPTTRRRARARASQYRSGQTPKTELPAEPNSETKSG